LFASLSRDTLFRTVSIADDAGVVVRSVERQAEAGVFVPVTHVRSRVAALASLVRTDALFLLPDEDLRISTTSARLGVGYDSSKQYGYSISPEDGIEAGGTVEIARRGFGARSDTTTVTADVRGYLPGLRRHHVLALRAATGLASGDDDARQSFSLGAVSASPSVIDFGSGALALMRDGHSTSGHRLFAANAEYRLPIATVERGIGTWPLFLRTLSTTAFADVGHVDGAPGRRVRRAFGVELSADAVAGYALPFHASIGIATADGPRERHQFTVYGRIGHAF
jgi:hypothetical protein